MWLRVPLAKKPGWWYVNKGIQINGGMLFVQIGENEMVTTNWREGETGSYRQIKQDFVGEVYVQTLQTIHIKVCWPDYEEKLCHLMLELGRYRRPKMPCFERICTICSGEVEDEIHFILRCPALVNAKRPLHDTCFELHEDFQTCTDIEKLNFILNNLNVNFVAKSIFQMFQLRKSLL